MKKLHDKKWIDFTIPDIFDDIQRGKRLKKADHIAGKMPYASSTANNNGIDDFIIASKGTRVFDNCISLANSGSVGNAFLEPFSFVASDHITALKKNKASKEDYLFLTAAIKMQKGNFDFNREINDNRVKNMRIMLPVTQNNTPDYQYMSVYISKKKKHMISKYETYVKKKIAHMQYKTIASLNDKPWDNFTLSDIFIIDSGKRLETRNKIPGNRPFIGASDSNNGITGFIGNTNSSLDKNVLGINYNGSVCVGFYHPYECIFSDDVKRFHLKKYHDNEFVLLFMKVAILQQASKFGYAYKFNATRMEHTKILLPVTQNNIPDYAYMEQFGKNIMLKKYKQYLKFLDGQQETQTR